MKTINLHLPLKIYLILLKVIRLNDDDEDDEDQEDEDIDELLARNNDDDDEIILNGRYSYFLAFKVILDICEKILWL